MPERLETQTGRDQKSLNITVELELHIWLVLHYFPSSISQEEDKGVLYDFESHFHQIYSMVWYYGMVPYS